VNVLRYLGFAALLAAVFGGGMLFQKFGVPTMKKTTYLRLQEPLLLEVLEPGAQQRNFHVLPAGTPLFKEYDFPEGFTQYKVYINIKAQFAAEEIVTDKPNLTDPIWAYPVKPEDLPKLIADTPVSKDDLVRILKARKMTREDLAQIVREWQD
jgi:hypothetical protein